MAHKEQVVFCQQIKSLYPAYFTNKDVLDCGSYDVNGNNRYLFQNCRYTGIDLTRGPNVDIVSKIHEYRTGEYGIYDVIISTECFEHDMYFPRSVQRIVELLKPDGLFLFTCAASGRPEHGTVKADPNSSPPTVAVGGGWETYYKNVSFIEGFEIGKHFRIFSVQINQDAKDLYFWGIKKKNET